MDELKTKVHDIYNALVQGMELFFVLIILLLLLQIFTCPLDKVPEHGGRHEYTEYDYM